MHMLIPQSLGPIGFELQQSDHERIVSLEPRRLFRDYTRRNSFEEKLGRVALHWIFHLPCNRALTNFG